MTVNALQTQIAAELTGYDAFIDATNVAGGIEGYLRMLVHVGDMLNADHGISLSRAEEMIEERGLREVMAAERRQAWPES